MGAGRFRPSAGNTSQSSPDVVTLSLARGLRRHEEATSLARIQRFVGSEAAPKERRFGPMARRLHEQMVRGAGRDRVLQVADTKSHKAWVVSIPADDGGSELGLFEVRKRPGGPLQSSHYLDIRLTPHFVERLIQLSGNGPVPFAALPWKIFCLAVKTLMGMPAGTLYAAVDGALLIAQYDGNRGLEFRTLIAERALDSDKQPLWQRLVAANSPIEFVVDGG